MKTQNNSVELVGNIGNIELYEFKNGKKVLNLSIARNEKFTMNGTEMSKTTWFNGAAWNNNTTKFEGFKKGDLVSIKGKLDPQTYTNNDGVKITKTLILVFETTLICASKDKYTQAAITESANVTEDEMPF